MMNLTKSILTAAMAVATLGVLPATSAQAQTSVSISYGDYGYREGYRDHDRYDRYDRGDYDRDYRRDHRRSWDRDRDGIPNRYDRYDNRRGWNGYASGYGYRDAPRCWTEWQYSRWSGERTRVRVCR